MVAFAILGGVILSVMTVTQRVNTADKTSSDQIKKIQYLVQESFKIQKMSYYSLENFYNTTSSNKCQNLDPEILTNNSFYEWMNVSTEFNLCIEISAFEKIGSGLNVFNVKLLGHFYNKNTKKITNRSFVIRKVK